MDQILHDLSEVYRGEHIIVRGDKEAKYDHIIKLLDLCKRHNVWNVSFAVSKEEPAGAGAGAP